MATSFNSRLSTAPEEGCKAPCVTVSLTNITLSGEQTIGVTAVVSGDRVLVAGQTDTTENGIYVCDSGAWARAKDWNTAEDVAPGMLIPVSATEELYQTKPFTDAYNPGVTAVTFGVGILSARNVETQLGSEAVSRLFTLTTTSYTPGANNLEVDHNGQRLNLTTDYTEPSASTVLIDASRTINANDVFTFRTNTTVSNSVTVTTAITHTRGGVGHNLATYLDGHVMEFDTMAAAVASTMLYEGAVVKVADRANSTWDAVLSSGVTENGYNVVQCTGVATISLVLRHDRILNVKAFGALGDDDQTLYPTSYLTDIGDTLNTITQQTFDGLVINHVITYLKSLGGGSIYLPSGSYRTYAYLLPIDFDCFIFGDSEAETIIKNCDASPTNVHSYGIFNCGGDSLVKVGFQRLTLDGNADTRTEPTAEFRSYTLSFYKKVRANLSNITSRNSPIDCLLSAYDSSTGESSLSASDCIFDHSFRNTVSLVHGDNQIFTNCTISGGGTVHSGTNPRYCLDVEPNLSTRSLKGVQFSNCHLYNAVNAIIGCVWSEITLTNCVIDAYGSAVPGYPWAFIFSQCQALLTGCRINGKEGELRTLSTNFGTDVAGSYRETQYLKIVGSVFYGCGFQGVGKRSILKDVTFMNSLYPVIYESSGTGRHEVTVENVTLINVLDGVNAGAGALSSFTIKNDTEGPVNINGLTIMIDPASLPTSPSFATGTAYGISLSTAGLVTSYIKVSNVHIEGYYQKYPNATSQALNASNFRDWGAPNTAPANTAGQTTTPGALYYANCTMYGNSP